MTNSDASSLNPVRLTVAILLVLLAHGPAAVAQRPILGSVSATGPAEVRGLAVAGDTTLFSGDGIRTRGEAYVRVLLTGGPQVELGGDSAVEIDRDESGFRLRMTGGRVAFSAPEVSAPVTVLVGPVRVSASAGAAAEIAWLEPSRIRILALRETVTVVQEGEGQGAGTADDDEVIISLDAPVEPDGDAAPEVSEAGSGGSATTWVLVGAGAGGAAGTVIFLTGGEREPASPTAP